MTDLKQLYNQPKRKIGTYEDFIQFDMSMYDAFPYKRNSTNCGADQIALNTGNVIKFNNVEKSTTYVINNND